MSLNELRRNRKSNPNAPAGDVRRLSLPLEKTERNDNFLNAETYKYFLACAEAEVTRTGIESGWWYYCEHAIAAKLIYPSREGDFKQLPEALENAFKDLEKRVASNSYKKAKEFSAFLASLKLARYLAPHDPRTEHYWQILLGMKKQNKARRIMDRLLGVEPLLDYADCFNEISYLFGAEALVFLDYTPEEFSVCASIMLDNTRNSKERYKIFALIKIILPTALPELMQTADPKETAKNSLQDLIESGQYNSYLKRPNQALQLLHFLANINMLLSEKIEFTEGHIVFAYAENRPEFNASIIQQPQALDI